MVTPVCESPVCTIVEEDKVSDSGLIRSASEGRIIPSGRADSGQLDAFSIFLNDEMDLSSCDRIDLELSSEDWDSEWVSGVGGVDQPNKSIGPQRYVIDHSIRHELCASKCKHMLGGCRVQLNRCVFYRELYLSGDTDPMADFLFHGVSHGFDIVDPGCPSEYVCTNYRSIENGEFKVQMDKIVNDELVAEKISLVETTPRCVHSLGAVRKSSGKLRPITDCKRPLDVSINNYMTTTYAPFHYVTLDEISDQLVGGEYLAVVDIKSAYRSVNISIAHRQFQGFG